MECQAKHRTIEHSDASYAPEMFKVTNYGVQMRTSIQCLAHAEQAEARGCMVEIILT